MHKIIRVRPVHELEPGARRVVEIDDDKEVLILNIAGIVYAISNICPHQRAALERGRVEGTVLYCPLHRWGFALTTGASLDDENTCAPYLCH